MRTVITVAILFILGVSLVGFKVYTLTESLKKTQSALVEANTLLAEERANLVALNASKQRLEESLSYRVDQSKVIAKRKENTDAQLSNALSKPEVSNWGSTALPSDVDDIMRERTSKN